MERKRIVKPNFLLVAGNGRNVGKTFLSCSIIRHLSLTSHVVGVKVSSHFHPIGDNPVVVKNANYTIIEETQISKKDSSLMKQAGAKCVYFVMSPQKYMREAFSELEKLLPQSAIVCESGGLHEVIDPGLFLFVNRKGMEIRKKHHLQYAPIVVENDGLNFNFDVASISFKNQQFILNT